MPAGGADALQGMSGVERRAHALDCALAEARERVAELEGLLMDALHQGAYVKDGEIDTCALSVWEDIAYYFEERGLLVKTGGRTFKHKKDGA
jgi:hypothetical protein